MVKEEGEAAETELSEKDIEKIKKLTDDIAKLQEKLADYIKKEIEVAQRGDKINGLVLKKARGELLLAEELANLADAMCTGKKGDMKQLRERASEVKTALKNATKFLQNEVEQAKYLS